VLAPGAAFAANAGGGFAGTAGAAVGADTLGDAESPLCECQLPGFLFTSR
jgi:hypothetical protein